jgi:uncharacterized protein (TIGR04141 family)
VDALTIFQVKAGIRDPDDVIIERGKLWSQQVRIGGKLLGVLFARRSRPAPPSWLTYFDGVVDFSDIRLQTSSTSALLLIERRARLYAITFGQGRWLLQPNALEGRFGLATTLNAIDPLQIRSVDHKRLEAVTRFTKEQLSKASGLGLFGLDVERDLLRGVTGKPSDNTVGARLAGADSLSVVGDIPLRKLGEHLDRFARLASDTAYRANFSFVDNIAEIRDPALSAKLDKQLVKDIKAGTVDRTWLAPPEIMDWAEVGGFKYLSKGAADTYEDLDLDDYLSARRGKSALTADVLHQERVLCLNAADSAVRQQWTVYRCLVAEVKLKSDVYALSDGKWYRIDDVFLEQVEQSASSVSATALQLPPYGGLTEDEYNRRAARRSNGSLALVHPKTFATGLRGAVEPCDLFGPKVLLHVKRFGGSSSLSHLFSQGVVAGEVLQGDRMFRSDFWTFLPTTHRFETVGSPFSPTDYEVAFVVLGRQGATDLPFFSKVNLRNAVARLGQFGYRVTLTGVPRS